MTVIARSEATKQSSVLTLTLMLKLTLTEVRGFSPRTIYERARLRALSSKYEFDFKDFKEFDFKDFDFYFFSSKQKI
jgi:hypothetical protein